MVREAVRRFVYLVLALYFLSRMFRSAMKLSEQETYFSEDIAYEHGALFPSVTLCPRFEVSRGLYDVVGSATNMTESFDVSTRELPKLVLNLEHKVVVNGREVDVRHPNYGVVLLPYVPEIEYIVGCLIYDPPGKVFPDFNYSVFLAPNPSTSF